MGKKPAQPSYTGVQWHDVSEAMESGRSDYEEGEISAELYPNGLGIFTLSVRHWQTINGEAILCETTEPWSASKGRLEAFVYRSIIDTLKEADRRVAIANTAKGVNG